MFTPAWITYVMPSHIFCLLAVVGLGFASLSAAELPQREQTVTGTTSDGSSTVLVKVKGDSALPGSERDHVVKVNIPADAVPGTKGDFSQVVHYYPGKNTVTVTSATKEETRQAVYTISEPVLIVKLDWEGNDLDYDLYVNDINYINTESNGGKLSRDAYASRNNDGTGGEGPGKENIEFKSAKPGVYKIYVNYFSDHDNGGSSPTTVKVQLGRNEIFNQTKTISDSESLAENLAGNGKSVWNVATVIIHGDKPGGYQVVDENWSVLPLTPSPDKGTGWRDIFLPANGKPIVRFGNDLGIFPRTDFKTNSLVPPIGSKWFPLIRGKSAQFTAIGMVNVGSSNQQSCAIIGEFESSDPGVGYIDNLGVLSGIKAGRTEIDVNKYGNSLAKTVTVDVLDPQFKPKYAATGTIVDASLNYAPKDATCDFIRFLNTDGQDITIVRTSVPADWDQHLLPKAWEEKIVILEQKAGADGKGLQLFVGDKVKTGYYDVQVDIGAIAPDLSGKYHVGEFGKHMMKGALTILAIEGLAGHRFGSIHMKKMFKKDPPFSRFGYVPYDGPVKFGDFWFVTDKIGTDDPNFGIFKITPVKGVKKYELQGCTQVGPSMYAGYQGLINAMNSAQQLLVYLGLLDPANYHEYTLNELFTFVMSRQGYDITALEASTGLYWQSPSFTLPEKKEIPGKAFLDENNWIPMQLTLSVEKMSLRLDSNNDRKVNEQDDIVKKHQAFKFWTNTNNSYSETGVDDSTNDSSVVNDAFDSHINGLRDLIDFARLNISMSPGLTDVLNNSNDPYRIHFTRIGTGAINMFPIIAGSDEKEEAGADDTYLTSRGRGVLALDSARNKSVHEALWNGTRPTGYKYFLDNWFLFEGAELGEFTLHLALIDTRTNEEIASDEVKISLKPIEQFYVRLDAYTPLVPNNLEFIAVGAAEERYSTLNPLPGKGLSEISEGAKVLIFFHGFNVDAIAAKRWYDETYKRLYWTGFKDELIGVQWDGAEPGLLVSPAGRYNTNIHNAFKTGSLLATWLPSFAANHDVSMLTHSAGGPATLEALRLIQMTNPGATKIRNLITMEAATFGNVYSPSLGTMDGWPGSFDNYSWNNWFAQSLNRVSGKYENLYSADDFTLNTTLIANENVGVGKLAGHAVNATARRVLQVSNRDAWTLSFVNPGIHSFGPDTFGLKCVIPHDTNPLGTHPAPNVANHNCEPVGFGINNGVRNLIAGSHSFMRETNYDETRLLFRRIYEVIK